MKKAFCTAVQNAFLLMTRKLAIVIWVGIAEDVVVGITLSDASVGSIHDANPSVGDRRNDSGVAGAKTFCPAAELPEHNIAWLRRKINPATAGIPVVIVMRSSALCAIAEEDIQVRSMEGIPNNDMQGPYGQISPPLAARAPGQSGCLPIWERAELIRRSTICCFEYCAPV